MNIYNLQNRFYQIKQALEDNEGLLTDEIEKSLLQNEEDFKQNAQDLALLILEVENESMLLANEMKRLANLKKQKEIAIENLRNNLLKSLKFYSKEDKRGVFRYDCPFVKISTRKSEVIEIIEIGKISEGFYDKEILIKPRKDIIKEFIKNGGEVEGAVLVEKLNLQIK